jgi:hypothetical protein
MVTKRIDVITQKIHDVLDGAKDTFTPKVAAVYYGDQEKIPIFPAIAVEGGTKSRTLKATRTWAIGLEVTIYIHHGQVQSSEITRKETDSLAEQIEDVLHARLTMDGDVIFGFVNRADSGVAMRDDVMLRTTRMTWGATSEERF